MNIQELKTKSSEHLINQAEELGIEKREHTKKTGNCFCNFKKNLQKKEEITGGGVLHYCKMALDF